MSDIVDAKLDRWVELEKEISEKEAVLSELKQELNSLAFDLPALFNEAGIESVTRHGKRFFPERFFSATLKGDDRKAKAEAKAKLMELVRNNPEAKHLIKDSLHMGSFGSYLKDYDPDGKATLETILEEMPQEFLEVVNVTSATRIKGQKVS